MGLQLPRLRNFLFTAWRNLVPQLAERFAFLSFTQKKTLAQSLQFYMFDTL